MSRKIHLDLAKRSLRVVGGALFMCLAFASPSLAAATTSRWTLSPQVGPRATLESGQFHGWPATAGHWELRPDIGPRAVVGRTHPIWIASRAPKTASIVTPVASASK